MIGPDDALQLELVCKDICVDWSAISFTVKCPRPKLLAKMRLRHALWSLHDAMKLCEKALRHKPLLECFKHGLIEVEDLLELATHFGDTKTMMFAYRKVHTRERRFYRLCT